MKDITYIGLDVHKTTVCVAIAESGRGGGVRELAYSRTGPTTISRAIAASPPRRVVRASIPRRTSATGVLRHMRRHCHRAQLIDEVFRVVGLVGTERVRARPVGARFDRGERRYPLGMAVSRRRENKHQPEAHGGSPSNHGR